MIKYSILNPAKVNSVNITVKFNEDKYSGSIITYDPITLSEGNVIEFGIKISAIFIHGREILDDELKAFVSGDIPKDFSEIASDVFYDLLQLYKDNIQYE